FHRLVAEAGVLEVEEDEIAAGRLQNVTDAGRRELDHEMAELRRPVPGHPLEALVRQSFLPFPPLFGGFAYCAVTALPPQQDRRGSAKVRRRRDRHASSCQASAHWRSPRSNFTVNRALSDSLYAVPQMEAMNRTAFDIRRFSPARISK